MNVKLTGFSLVIGVCLLLPLGAAAQAQVEASTGDGDASAPNRWRHVEEFTIETDDAVTLFVRTVGGPGHNARTVIFLAGGPGFSHHYATGLDRAAGPMLKLVYYDHRGVGGSSVPADGDYSQEAMLADLDAVRRAVSSQPVTLVGHSFGGFLAMAYATDERYSSQVHSIVLIGSEPPSTRGDSLFWICGSPDEPDELHEECVGRLWGWKDPNCREWDELIEMGLMCGPACWTDYCAFFQDIMVSFAYEVSCGDDPYGFTPPPGWAEVACTVEGEAIWGAFHFREECGADGCDLTEAVSALDIPVWVTGGTQDEYFRFVERETISAFYGTAVTTVFFPRSAHIPWVSTPELVATTIRLAAGVR